MNCCVLYSFHTECVYVLLLGCDALSFTVPILRLRTHELGANFSFTTKVGAVKDTSTIRLIKKATLQRGSNWDDSKLHRDSFSLNKTLDVEMSLQCYSLRRESNHNTGNSA